MIALDGEFCRADVEGRVSPVAAGSLTPFAVISRFRPTVDTSLEGPLSLAELEAALDRPLDTGEPAVAIRIDGDFDFVTARSVPARRPPYRPLVEVVLDQNVFEIDSTRGSLVGFRFPEWSEGLELGGYHLHFVDEDRRRGGRVLDLRIRAGRLRAESVSDLCIELPRGIKLVSPGLSEDTHRALERADRGDLD